MWSGSSCSPCPTKTSTPPSRPNWRSWQPADKLRLLARIRSMLAACSRTADLSPPEFLTRLRLQDHQGAWLPFLPWPSQLPALTAMTTARRLVILKARQLGLTWLALAHALRVMLSEPGVTVLLFSVGLREAHELLRRLRGLYRHASDVVRTGGKDHGGAGSWTLPNGSRVLSFPASAGISYTARLAVIDEADRGDDLAGLLDRVQPTVDAGGQLFLISTADKGTPESTFKRIYLEAAAGSTSWQALFLPWSARPDRTRQWYDRECADCLRNTGSLDHCYQEYPESAEQALAPRQLDKRFPYAWLAAVFSSLPGRPAPELAPGLTVFAPPVQGHRYVIGADPAEGNPTSDESAACVLDQDSGEQVAVLGGRLEPTLFALAVGKVADHYHRAAVLVERNNHGHAVLAALREHCDVRRLKGHDGREGWLSSGKGKTLLYDACADAIRERQVLLHDRTTHLQLAGIEGATLRAPQGQADDRATAFALAVQALVRAPRGGYRYGWV